MQRKHYLFLKYYNWRLKYIFLQIFQRKVINFADIRLYSMNLTELLIAISSMGICNLVSTQISCTPWKRDYLFPSGYGTTCSPIEYMYGCQSKLQQHYTYQTNTSYHNHLTKKGRFCTYTSKMLNVNKIESTLFITLAPYKVFTKIT